MWTEGGASWPEVTDRSGLFDDCRNQVHSATERRSDVFGRLRWPADSGNYLSGQNIIEISLCWIKIWGWYIFVIVVGSI